MRAVVLRPYCNNCIAGSYTTASCEARSNISTVVCQYNRRVRGRVTALRFNQMASILLLHKYEHGSWYITTVLPELIPYCSVTDKTLRYYACKTNPITRRANTPTTHR